MHPAQVATQSQEGALGPPTAALLLSAFASNHHPSGALSQLPQLATAPPPSLPASMQALAAVGAASIRRVSQQSATCMEDALLVMKMSTEGTQQGQGQEVPQSPASYQLDAAPMTAGTGATGAEATASPAQAKGRLVACDQGAPQAPTSTCCALGEQAGPEPSLASKGSSAAAARAPSPVACKQAGLATAAQAAAGMQAQAGLHAGAGVHLFHPLPCPQPAGPESFLGNQRSPLSSQGPCASLPALNEDTPFSEGSDVAGAGEAASAATGAAAQGQLGPVDGSGARAQRPVAMRPAFRASMQALAQRISASPEDLALPPKADIQAMPATWAAALPQPSSSLVKIGSGSPVWSICSDGLKNSKALALLHQSSALRAAYGSNRGCGQTEGAAADKAQSQTQGGEEQRRALFHHAAHALHSTTTMASTRRKPPSSQTSFGALFKAALVLGSPLVSGEA